MCILVAAEIDYLIPSFLCFEVARRRPFRKGSGDQNTIGNPRRINFGVQVTESPAFTSFKRFGELKLPKMNGFCDDFHSRFEVEFSSG
ncbi:ATP-dependent helicase [Sesbania bispinosa]|nr:ATP-dependent helicase [Sesbania bispinosa]